MFKFDSKAPVIGLYGFDSSSFIHGLGFYTYDLESDCQGFEEPVVEPEPAPEPVPDTEPETEKEEDEEEPIDETDQVQEPVVPVDIIDEE